MSHIESVSLAEIDTNPFRRLGDYPYNEKKLDELKRSISDVGLWEGVIGRRNGNRVEIAFGHHRIEAARRLKMTAGDLIIRELTDDQMLEFMGRENGEEYNTDFRCLLETWEAAVNHLGAEHGSRLAAAELLGWTTPNGAQSGRANACAKALKAVNEGLTHRENLTGLNVYQANTLIGELQEQIAVIDNPLSKTKRTEEEKAQAKKETVEDVNAIIEEVGAGEVGTQDARTRIKVARGQAEERVSPKPVTQRPLPELWSAARTMENRIGTILLNDATADKLDQLVEAYPIIVQEDQDTLLAGIIKELEALERRAATYRRKLSGETVLDVIEGGMA